MTLGPDLVGASAAMTVEVTPDLAARFDDEEVHAVYGTASLVLHTEQVSRRLLRPHLGPRQEGVGAELWVRQEAPVAVGGQVEVVATVTDATPRRLTTAVVATAAGEVVARATFTQVVVDLDSWRT